MEVFDNELNDYLESLENTNECSECGEAINESKSYCSEQCFKASML